MTETVVGHFMSLITGQLCSVACRSNLCKINVKKINMNCFRISGLVPMEALRGLRHTEPSAAILYLSTKCFGLFWFVCELKILPTCSWPSNERVGLTVPCTESHPSFFLMQASVSFKKLSEITHWNCIFGAPLRWVTTLQLPHTMPSLKRAGPSDRRLHWPASLEGNTSLLCHWVSVCVFWWENNRSMQERYCQFGSFCCLQNLFLASALCQYVYVIFIPCSSAVSYL